MGVNSFCHLKRYVGLPIGNTLPRQCAAKPRITPYLSRDMWRAVKNAIDAMPGATERERLHAARCAAGC